MRSIDRASYGRVKYLAMLDVASPLCMGNQYPPYPVGYPMDELHVISVWRIPSQQYNRIVSRIKASDQDAV